MKKVLLIAGDGTLGSYTAQELLRLGHSVDVVGLKALSSSEPRLRYYRADATIPYLRKLFQENRYDGIVNFLHFPDAAQYPPYHELLSQNTEHLIFLSSYRVYSDLEHPITETTPQLLDVIKDDPTFLLKEDYALAKSRAERFLRNNPYPKNWTIVRPVISFSHRRLDLVLVTGRELAEAAKAGKTVRLPLAAKHLTAGLDWAGNSGKLIANLMFKQASLGEAYTVSSAQNLTWEKVGELYERLLSVKIEWAKTEYPRDLWIWHYDRAYDRRIDNTKILQATGLSAKDFKSIENGISIELAKLTDTKRRPT